MAYSVTTRGEHLVRIEGATGRISFVNRKGLKLEAGAVLKGEFQQTMGSTDTDFSGNIRSMILDSSGTDSQVIGNLFGGSVERNEF